MKNRKKPLIITLICIVIVAAAAAGVWFLWLKDYLAAAGATPVYVNPISSIVGLDTGSNPRYSGIVEPQEVYKINKDETKTVAEILVSEGDEIHVGDVLFRYSTEQMEVDLGQALLDQETIAQRISTLKTQKNTLEAEKKKASQDEQFYYTTQIQAVDLDIRVQESESKKKKLEVDNLRESLANADVCSEVDGVVKKVNSSSQTDPYSGQESAFITVLSSGEYRVKGTVSELNISSLTIGQPVTVHSRVDSQMVWNGTVDSIDQEAAENQNGNMYYYGMDSGEKSSKYNFYVALENPEGLILGQHVYIEPDLGEPAQKEGLWLPAVYVAHDENGSFVWVKNEKDKLEKRFVTLGDYDDENDKYQIKSGVTKADSIAYPSEDLMPGMPTTTDASMQAVSPVGEGGYDGMDNTVLPEGDGTVLPEEGLSSGTVSGEFFDDSYGNSVGYDDSYNGDPTAADSYDDGFSVSSDASGGEGYLE